MTEKYRIEKQTNERENSAPFGFTCSGTISDPGVVKKQLLIKKILNAKNSCMTVLHRGDLGKSATGYFCNVKGNATG